MATAKLPSPADNNILSLLIVAKAKMNQGWCYMGFNKKTNALVRPLYCAEKNKQCWPSYKVFTVGETVEFKVVRALPEQSSLPHRDVDVLVDKEVNRLNPADSFSPKRVFETLSELSFPTVNEIFGNENNTFVREGAACPSVGIYRCNGDNINLSMVQNTYNGKQRRRCIIEEPSRKYDLSITAEEAYQKPKPNDSVLLLLGLARPWRKGDDPKEEKRCYILVIGMVIKPPDSDTPGADHLAVDFPSVSPCGH